MIIQVENTSKSFISNKKTLNSITLDINHNSINVIYGKSGSGKTTLLNILAGLDINFDGNVKILGQKSAVVVDRIYSACLKLNAVSNAEIEEIAGN